MSAPRFQSTRGTTSTLPSRVSQQSEKSTGSYKAFRLLPSPKHHTTRPVGLSNAANLRMSTSNTAPSLPQLPNRADAHQWTSPSATQLTSTATVAAALPSVSQHAGAPRLYAATSSSAAAEASGRMPSPLQHSLIGPEMKLTDRSILSWWGGGRSAMHTQEQRENSRLWAWWHDRRQCRWDEEQMHELAIDIGAVLQEDLRSLLTTEEAEWRRQEGAPHRVPVVKIPGILHAARLHLHSSCVAYLKTSSFLSENMDTYAAAAAAATVPRGSVGGSTTVEASRNSRCLAALNELNDAQRSEAAEKLQQREALVLDLLTAEEILVEEASGSPLDAVLPSAVSLPPERTLPPLIQLETACSVVLLWHILDEAKGQSPGMDFAMQLLGHYIMPHVYDGFLQWSAVWPTLGGLSEQILHLSTVPLRSLALTNATRAASQSVSDTKYLENVLKVWALRAWRREVLAQRRAAMLAASIQGIISRQRNRLFLQRVFGAWRRETLNAQANMQLSEMEDAYRQFVNDGAVSSRLELLPSTVPATLSFDNLQLTRRSSVTSNSSAGGETVEERQFFSTVNRAVCVAGKLVQGAVAEGPHSKMKESPLRSAARRKKIGAGHSRFNVSFLKPQKGEATRQAVCHLSADDEDEAEAHDPMLMDPDGKSLMYLEKDEETSVTQLMTMTGVFPPTLGSALDSSTVTTAPKEAETMSDKPHSNTPAVILPHHRASIAQQSAESGADGHSVILNSTANLFVSMLSKLQELEEVAGYLRAELQAQSQRMRKVEAENFGLRQRNRVLEADMVAVVAEKLQACNQAQQNERIIQEKNNHIIQLKSRLRAHRHRPWQRTVLRNVGEMCGVATTSTEQADEKRIYLDRYGDATANGGGSQQSGKHGAKSPNQVPEMYPGAPLALQHSKSWTSGEDQQRQSSTPSSEENGAAHHRAKSVGATVSAASTDFEEEQLFSAMMPIVLGSTPVFPDAAVILLDWVNGCLDDMQALDDLKGGVLSSRFDYFSEEARSGVLISRLLFYLALPRYLPSTSAAYATAATDRRSLASLALSSISNNGGATGNSMGAQIDYAECRRQLLENRGVQLNPPYPIYAECFGDLLSMAPVDRMEQLLAFASELVARSTEFSSAAVESMNELLGAAAANAEKNGDPAAAAGSGVSVDSHLSNGGVAAVFPRGSMIPLHTIIDPFALARGDRGTIMTLIALLYIRFAHPFHHKCQQSAKAERTALLQLISKGNATTDELAWPSPQKAKPVSPDGEETPKHDDAAIEADMLEQLEVEDRTPWQLFKERCLPIFGTNAHPFLLRGGFWPSDAFESPELAAMLSALSAALRRSLDAHRWHITLSCLVPVLTYSGLSRGVFTGPGASPMAFHVGLRQEGQWSLPLRAPIVDDVVAQYHTTPATVANAPAVMGSPSSAVELLSPPSTVDLQAEAQQLSDEVLLFQEDMLTVFLQRAALSPLLGLPVLDLGGWRLLCSDLRLISMASPEDDADQNYTPLLDMEVVTRIFQDAIMTTEQDQQELHQQRQPSDEAEGGESLHTVSNSISISRENEMKSVKLRSSVRNDSYSKNDVVLPTLQVDMTYQTFSIALVLLSRKIHVAKTAPRPPFMDVAPAASTAAEAFKGMMCSVVLPSSASQMQAKNPKQMLRQLTMGVNTQGVLHRYTPALLYVYQAYGKDVYGEIGMVREDILRLLRDAMLTSTELSQYLIYDLFQNCCVVREAAEETTIGQRKAFDAEPRDANVKGNEAAGGVMSHQRRSGYRAVRIVDPRVTQDAAVAAKRKKALMLTFDGFCDLLCVLCNFKQPNVFIPFEERLAIFFRRSLLRPLTHVVPGLTPLLARTPAPQTSGESTIIKSSATDDGLTASRTGMRQK